MSSYGLFDTSFDKPVRKWKKPEPPKEAAESPRASSYIHDDFIGGCEPSTPRKRWQKPKAAEPSSPSSTNGTAHRVHEEWLSPSVSYSARDRPAPIKIEGRRGSIKDSPFFKNFGGL